MVIVTLKMEFVVAFLDFLELTVVSKMLLTFHASIIVIQMEFAIHQPDFVIVI